LDDKSFLAADVWATDSSTNRKPDPTNPNINPNSLILSQINTTVAQMSVV